MSEMVNKVARALADRAGGPVTDAYLADAEAAIQAMDVPTEQMIERYCRTITHLGFHSWVNLSTIWPALIDEALR